MDGIVKRLMQNIDNSVIFNLPPFMTYLIGNNGTGKSRLLARVSEIYDQDHNTNIKKILCISNAINDRFKFSDTDKRRYLGARSVGNAIFRTSGDRKIVEHFIGASLPHNKGHLKKLLSSLGYSLQLKFSAAPDKIIDADTLKQTVPEKYRPNFNKKIIESQRDWLVEFFSEKNIDDIKEHQKNILINYMIYRPDVELVVVAQDAKIPFGDLSSGEQNRITTALKIIAHAGDYSLILIDEPEISLHLSWQIEFHAFIKEIISGYENCHVLIATHSPVIVSEAAKDEQADAFIVLQPPVVKMSVPDSELEFVNCRSATPNELKSCDALTLDLFDTATYNSKAIDYRIAEAILDASEPDSRVQNEIERLEKLIGKAGVTKEKENTIYQAISLIKKHILDTKL